jgi:hypothetical protein
MLGATVLLWGTAGRLFGRRAAFFAAAVFAVLGPTLHLGSFATYDALSVFLIALASWCVVRAGDRGEATGWMVTAGVVLAVANAAAYSSALFDLFVLALEVGNFGNARYARSVFEGAYANMASRALADGRIDRSEVDEIIVDDLPTEDPFSTAQHRIGFRPR